MRIRMSSAVLTRCASARKTTKIVIGLSVISVISLLILSLRRLTPFEDFHVYDIQLRSPSQPLEAQPPSSNDGHSPHRQQPADDPFKQVQDLEIFLYSAIANDHEPVPGEINIIITAFDSTGTDHLRCCVVVKEEGKLYTSPASVFYKFYVEDVLGPVLEWFKYAPTKAKQYACVVPQLGFKVSHVTLTSSACPVEEDSYLPIVYPDIVPQGLALCAKAAFGDQLEPQKLMEWFEVQRLLGVDHVQLMDLHCPPPVQKVLRYYSDMGLLSALPYHLPGRPYGRGLDSGHWVSQQASHDESFPILDCRQRLRGYSFIMGHDMDEVLVPAAHYRNIKDLLRQQMMINTDAAGFFFYTQFFVYDWGPQNEDSDVHYFRFLNSTLPRNECKKYVYTSSRVEQARTHTFTPRGPYQQYFVPKEEAILHHYRKCPHVWSTCDQQGLTDKSMLRFQGVLDQRLKEARKAIGLDPKI